MGKKHGSLSAVFIQCLTLNCHLFSSVLAAHVTYFILKFKFDKWRATRLSSVLCLQFIVTMIVPTVCCCVVSFEWNALIRAHTHTSIQIHPFDTWRWNGLFTQKKTVEEELTKLTHKQRTIKEWRKQPNTHTHMWMVYAMPKGVRCILYVSGVCVSMSVTVKLFPQLTSHTMSYCV